jgi:methylmalonyl-CoA mutase cobalamin-binding subunit
LTAVEKLDPQELQFQLERAASTLSQPTLIEGLLLPLLERMGEFWEDGTIRVVHEHVASAVIQTFLGNLIGVYVESDNAPAIVIGTPLRQSHEFGALIAAATAASEGWRVTYLGSSLPAEEIAGAANLRGANVVGLSIVYPSDDPYLEAELKRLRRFLGDETLVIVGGLAASGYARAVDSISGRLVADMTEFRKVLRERRR